MQISVFHKIRLPDPIRLERFKRAPDLGPRILFFSGGSALRALCGELIQFTYNSIHIITPFDSGGSSAKLREAFRMLAIGDVRNRLLALADRSLHGNPEIFELFAHRFPEDAPPEQLTGEMDSMIKGYHPLVSKIPDPMRKIIRHYLKQFKNHMPSDFDLHKASIGNLILTGGFLENDRLVDPVIFIFSKLVQVRGIVRPVVNKYRHLVAEMADGGTIVGQHLITGKETDPLSTPIKRLYLSEDRKEPKPSKVPIRKKMKDLIGEADMICYPIGSFFSSVIANLLPEGVGNAISGNSCPKIYIPNTKGDPELLGHDINDQIRVLISYMVKDDPDKIFPQNVLNYVLVDQKNGIYPGKLDQAFLKSVGVEMIDCPLVSPESAPYLDEKLLASVLLSLAC